MEIREVEARNPVPLDSTAARAALHASLEAHLGELLATIRLLVARGDLARGGAIRVAALEILQQTAIEALEGADRFDPSRPAMPWLLAIAINLIRQQQVKQARRARIAPLQPLDGDGDRPVVDPPDPFDTLLALEGSEQIEHLLAPLNADQQEVIRLAVLRDFDHKQVALALGISPGNARVRLHRALTALRSTLLSTTTDGRHE